MRSGGDHLILAPPDTTGFLGAAALRRRLAKDTDVQFLWGHEVSRRLTAVADEPDVVHPIVVDLVPTDSVQGLLLPALQRLVERGAMATWYYGRQTPAPGLRALSESVHLVYEEGAGSWRLISEDDAAFEALAEAIERASGEGSRWRLLLRALTTSWDWARIYRTLGVLAELGPVSDEDLGWAGSQIAEAERAETLVATAGTRSVWAARIAVVKDPTIPARVRPEVFRSVRSDVDALVFVGGPRRLVVVATHEESHLTFLSELSAEERLTVGSVSGSRADVAWPPGEVPAPVAALVGEDAFSEIPASEAPHESAAVVHEDAERIAKGMDVAALKGGDRAALIDGIREYVERRRG